MAWLFNHRSVACVRRGRMSGTYWRNWELSLKSTHWASTTPKALTGISRKRAESRRPVVSPRPTQGGSAPSGHSAHARRKALLARLFAIPRIGRVCRSLKCGRIPAGSPCCRRFARLTSTASRLAPLPFDSRPAVDLPHRLRREPVPTCQSAKSARYPNLTLEGSIAMRASRFFILGVLPVSFLSGSVLFSARARAQDFHVETTLLAVGRPEPKELMRS